MNDRHRRNAGDDAKQADHVKHDCEDEESIPIHSRNRSRATADAWQTDRGTKPKSGNARQKEDYGFPQCNYLSFN